MLVPTWRSCGLLSDQCANLAKGEQPYFRFFFHLCPLDAKDDYPENLVYILGANY